MDLCHKIGQAGQLIDAHQAGKAQALLDDLLAIAPSLIDGHSLQAKLFASQGRYREAKQAYQEALALAPNRLTLLVAMVDVCLELNEVGEALDLSAIVTDLAPRLGPPLLFPVFDRHDQVRQAADMARRTLKNAPQPVEAHLVLARACAATGDRSTAASHLQAACAAIDLTTPSPRAADALFTRGFVAAQQNQVEEALDAFQRAIAMNPNHAKSQMYLFLSLFTLNRPEEAKRALAAWIDAYPLPNNLILAAKMCDVVGLPSLAEAYRKRSTPAQ